MAIITEKLLPHAPDAESAVISCILQNPAGTMDEVFMQLTSDDYFRTPELYVLCGILRELYEAGSLDKLDMVVITDTLTAMNQLEAVGGEIHLQGLYNFVPTVAKLDVYLERVIEAYRHRQIVNALGAATNAIPETASGEVIETLTDRLHEIATVGAVGGAQSLDDVAEDAAATYEQLRTKKYIGLKTGFVDVDNLIKGLRPGNMYVIAARPTLGKTSLAMNIATYVAKEHGAVGVFSLEMPTSDLMLRMASADVGLSLDAPAMANHITATIAKLRKLPIYIADQAAPTIADIRYRAKQMLMRYGIKLLIADYLQLMGDTHGRSFGTREQQVAHQSKQFKQLLRELGIPGILVCQLNREAGARGWPKMADLRESGAIEQDADLVALIHRERSIDSGKGEVEDPLIGQESKLIIAKNRNGPIGIITLLFFAAYFRFESYHRINDNEIPI